MKENGSYRRFVTPVMTRRELNCEACLKKSSIAARCDPIDLGREDARSVEWSPGERARQTAQRLLLVGGALGRIAQSRGIPEAPEWMQPPTTLTIAYGGHTTRRRLSM